MDTLKNKRCIVTGAGSGIGKAITMSPVSYTHLTLPTSDLV